MYEIGVVGIRGGWGERCLNNNKKPTYYQSVFQSRVTTAYKLKLYTSTEKWKGCGHQATSWSSSRKKKMPHQFLALYPNTFPSICSSKQNVYWFCAVLTKKEWLTHRYVLFLFIATPTTGAWWQRGCAETAAPDAGHRSGYSQKRQNWNFHPDGVHLMTLARDPPGLIRPQPPV